MPTTPEYETFKAFEPCGRGLCIYTRNLEANNIPSVWQKEGLNASKKCREIKKTAGGVRLAGAGRSETAQIWGYRSDKVTPNRCKNGLIGILEGGQIAEIKPTLDS